MGPSGAGKSTLLSIIGMLDGAWTGDYYFLGEPVHKLNVKKRNELHKANIGFVFQSYHLIDNLTVFENLEVPLSYKNVPHKERISLVCDALDRFHIVGKKDLFPNQLSGGQQQLVGELVREKIFLAHDVKSVEGVANQANAFLVRHVLVGERDLQIFENGQIVDEVITLKHKANVRG